MRALQVETVQGLVLVEDGGRPGHAHLGVPRSGALDLAALRLANRLVGNPELTAGLEILAGDVVVRAEESLRVALTGGQLRLLVDGRHAPWGASVSVPSGSRIRVSAAPGALRSWLAVSGGLDVPAVLGSRSTDTLSGLGPPPVRAGDVLPVGVPRRSPSAPPRPTRLVPRDQPGETVVLHVRWGPRDDWFTSASHQTLTSGTYVVSPSSSRVALRLAGGPLVRRHQGELASEGLVTGAVQVPGDGQPLVFLADHPTTGGYPVVAVVTETDLPQCAQLRPGDVVRFTAV